MVCWTKPERPDWMDEALYAQLPEELMIRELRVKVQNDGFRVDELILVTTMLDPEVYTKEELAELFLQRWNIELDLRSIKSVMQMDVLRRETPSMVEKEIWMHLLAYNLIRTLMARGGGASEGAATVEFPRSHAGAGDVSRTAAMDPGSPPSPALGGAVAGHRLL